MIPVLSTIEGAPAKREGVPAKPKGVRAKRSKTTRHLPLHERQFYHSHTGQPMALEEVLSDRDSENEVDDDDETAHLVDSQMLVSMDDNEIMEKFIQLWNSFVKRQRVVADSHMPWACEAFSRLYMKELHDNLKFHMCWRVFMIRQWDYGILKAETMTKCNTIIHNYPNSKNAEDMDVDNNDHSSKNNDDKEATTHASGSECPMCRNGEKDEMDVGVEALETESSQVVDTTASTERSLGKRPIKVTQKMKEMKLASVARRRRSHGRGGRGGCSCGGRGSHGNLI